MGISLQRIIDIIRRKTGAMPLIADKYVGISRNPKIRTLALGSSHMMFGYLPSIDEYNLAFPSQDLYSSYELYKIYNNENIKNIIMCFSVFTPGQKLCLGSVAEASAMLKVIFGIEYQHPDMIDMDKTKKRENFYRTEFKRYLKKLKLKDTYRGNLTKHGKMRTGEEHIKDIALKHLKNNQRENDNMQSCIDLINETKKNNQNLYFVIPPVTNCYKSVLPSSDVMFKKLYDVVENQPHVKVLNFYDSNEYIDSDFHDGDHLKTCGAEKLTKAINEVIYS